MKKGKRYYFQRINDFLEDYGYAIAKFKKPSRNGK